MPPLPFYCMPSLGQEAVAESLTNSLINCLKSSLNASQAVVEEHHLGMQLTGDPIYHKRRSTALSG